MELLGLIMRPAQLMPQPACSARHQHSCLLWRCREREARWAMSPQHDARGTGPFGAYVCFMDNRWRARVYVRPRSTCLMRMKSSSKFITDCSIPHGHPRRRLLMRKAIQGC